MTFEKIHSSIRFLALFLALLSEGRGGRGGGGGGGGGGGTFPYDFKSDGASTTLDLRGRQYQRRAIISLTNMARSPTRKRLVTLKYIGVSFFPSPRISRLALNSLRNVRTSLMRELRGDTATKNRTYHNRMRDARAIVETLRQFFHIQSDRFLYHDSALRRNCVSWEPFVVVVPTYVSRRLIRDNRFYDYVPPRCESADACATFSLDVLWWALLNRITSQLFCGIIKSRRNWNF